MNADTSYTGRHEIVHPCNSEIPSLDHRYVHSDRARELEKLIRCSIRTFDRHLNTTETRILKRAARRLGIPICVNLSPSAVNQPAL